MYLEIPVKTNFEQELVDKRSKGTRHYMELYAEDTFVYIRWLYAIQWIVLHSLSFICDVFLGTY